MKILLKQAMEETKLDYKEIVESVNELYPEWEPKGGMNASITPEMLTRMLAKHGIKPETTENTTEENVEGKTINELTKDDDANRSINTNIKNAPHNPEIERKHSTLTERLLFHFNETQGEVVDPLKIKAEMSQIEKDYRKVSIKLEEMSKVSSNIKKTIVNDGQMRDVNYMRTLLRQYKFLVRPRLGRRLKEMIDSSFLEVYTTNEFVNRMIAFNDKEILHIYIINV